MTKAAKGKATATRSAKRAAARQSKAEKNRLRKAAEEARKEEADEAIAPAAMRNDVLDQEGRVVRAARVTRDGVTFTRSSAIVRMFKRGASKGEGATVRQSHVEACDRLLRAWEDGGQGVGSVPSLLGERTSSMVTTGYISDAKLSAINYQTRMRNEFIGAMNWLGALWPIVKRVALDGADLVAWAQETGHDPDAARGYLQASLDRLVEYYATLDEPKRTKRAL